MRALVLALAAVVLLTLVAPVGAARRPHPLTKLWAEYPLVPKATETAAGSSAARPVAPPAAAAAEPASPGSGSTPWALWAALSGLVMLAVLAVARVSQPLVSQLRAHSPSVAKPTSRTPLVQYAPEPEPVVLVAGEEESRRYVFRRTGILRSRFVVVEDDPARGILALASSKSFWRVGGERVRERAAERAWDELVEDLRLSGWEPNTARPRSDYYVLLRRIEPERRWSSILPTIEAYTIGSDPRD